ncbi:MAG TPA: mechanosensitive ion channel domain-containing protein [Thermoanaerobaculia bacterium]|jgi:small-conductance mechanosensitive channel|nr:mechanosensitive ion channel domain-containing protein [Thermoanaerobaculia bacterium]
MTLALLGSVGLLSLLIALVAALQRRFFWVRQLAFPLYVAAATAALETFTLLEPGYRPAALAKIFNGALLFLGLVTVFRLLGLYLFDVRLTAQKGMRLPPLLPTVAMILVYLITGFVTLRLTFPQFDLAPLIATSAVTSLVLGLALQPILANFFAGLVISLEKPFRINDWIKVGDQEGRVVAITWRTTHVRTRDNDNVLIPNSKLADERVLNYYYPHPVHLERVKVSAHYDEPPYRVRRVLLDCGAAVAGVLDKPAPDVYVLAFETSSILYELRIWIEDVAQAPRIASDVRARIWEEFRREGIVIPYPIQTLQIARPRRPRLAAGEEADEGPRPARLFVAEGPERGRSLDLDGGTPATVGRSRSCSLPLTDPNASKEHLRLEWEDGAWVMTDLGSSHGTRVNGKPAERAVLEPFDRIAIGDTVMIFESDAIRPA